jgi:ATP-dependent DNA helicase Q1
MKDAEALVIKLILLRYLVEEFSQNAYTTNVYFTPGLNAVRITRHAREDLHLAPKIEMCFIRKRGRPTAGKKARPIVEINTAAAVETNASRATLPLKRKRVESTSGDDSDCVFLGSNETFTVSGCSTPLPPEEQDDDEGEGDDWQNVTQVQRSKGSSSRGRVRYGNAKENDNDDTEIVILSSD